jgi:hypothetical protein
MNRRDFFKGLVALGLVATLPKAEALVPLVEALPKKTSFAGNYFAIWKGRHFYHYSMFAGDIPANAEVYEVNMKKILFFPEGEDEKYGMGSVPSGMDAYWHHQ